jgi:hypothetical protein
MLNDGRLVEDDPDTDRTSSAVRDRHRRSCQFEWHTLAVARDNRSAIMLFRGRRPS